jgi:type IV pilus assembly protein PilE
MMHDSKPKVARRKARQSGVTLIEMMVVVVILAIIVAFAFPSYAQFVVRAKRSAGTSMLLQVADRQQQFFMDNKRYSATLSALGLPADTFMIGDEGAFLADGDSDRAYNISLSNTSATTYTVTATPQLKQAERDDTCGNLTLTHSGVKGTSAGGDNCW